MLETSEDADVTRNPKVPTGSEGQVADEKRISADQLSAVFEKQGSLRNLGSWRVLLGS